MRQCRKSTLTPFSLATFAIGDVQGCYDELQALLERVGFNRTHDRLWFVGDLVNRGPKSLEVLRFVKELGDRAVVVLGNHDLHLLTQHEGLERKRKDDTFVDVLAAPDARELVDWVRRRPMMHMEGNFAMVHAGLLPQWSIGKAFSLGKEVEKALAGPGYLEFLENMYGGKPERWDDALAGWDRLRVIVNAMTRMRFCTREGAMEFHTRGATPPPGYFSWYDTRAAAEAVIVFGHWSQLGLKLSERVAGLDSGCVWGGALSALRLEDRWLVQVPCRGYQPPGE
jgi:bis(5'-nucleosyl)-tetraphosphatase (symmetrical)